ncbi:MULTISPECIES: ABC transporter ATP-binding protein [unclassified Paenibacillus]|uniref:ABC transporter ATP-binding protein n=1 Tax=unclassified Paenibacillus TaxID=185978 RepID=UPI00096D901C|nr:ABC transporter ATP-binding protein [Paenibacillus sp. FSL H8-0259]OMF28861.1 ABC transporter ATP-binding protein [Paenibacillus sp. FSL H8-0259]
MLRKCLVHLKGWIALYILLGFIIQFISSLGIVVFQKILDQAVDGTGFSEITHWIVVYGVLLGANVLLNYADEYPGAHLSNSITERLKILALSKISRMDYTAYQNMGTGQMIKVIENGAAAGNSILFTFILGTLHELLPTILFSLFFISYYDLRIMLVIAGGYVVIFVITNVLLKYLYRIKAAVLKEQESMSRYSIRGFMELVVFRTNKKYAQEIGRLNETARQIISKSAQLQMIHESFFALFELFITVIKVIVLLYGVKNVVSGQASVGVMVALFMFIEKIYTPIAIFNVLFVGYKLNRVTYQRFGEFLNAPEDANLEKGKAVAGLQGDLEFRDVSFGYGEVQVLDRLSFSITHGTSVALVGLSGSGKSTVIKLITGLLKKSGGKLLVDGTDIDELSLNSYYDHISYLSQDSPVFDTTIRGNMVFDQDVPDEELYAVLDKVHLKEKVLELPEKLETMVGERGLKLSGGERQRLAFARALLQKRNLIILDEPVSALDNITEKSLMETVFAEFRNKTVIIIAHRLNFISGVDQILVMEQGRLVGEGNFDSLIRSCDSFRTLWNNGRGQTD